MASREEHCRDCVAALGEDFGKVHDWLDEFFSSLGPHHRYLRHHTGGVEEVRLMWGDKAAEAAILHIKKDYCGQVPSPRDSALMLSFDSGGKEPRHSRKEKDPKKFSVHPVRIPSAEEIKKYNK
jgi:hypothetical protein